jgi:predicted small metal-binding protein
MAAVFSPASDFPIFSRKTYVVRGNTEEEVLKNAAEHAKQYGIREVTPELKAKVRAAIRDEK